ncbi:MAG TPA: hypothetical protein VIP49_03975, partial [Candidatus Udaeobacter sp.]
RITASDKDDAEIPGHMSFVISTGAKRSGEISYYSDLVRQKLNKERCLQPSRKATAWQATPLDMTQEVTLHDSRSPE